MANELIDNPTAISGPRPTIIAVRGVANRGKSATIKRVAALLQASPGASARWIVTGVDIQVIITIGGITIGIESQGDPGSRLFASLDLFVRLRCTIIICATRTYGGTVDAVNALRDHYSVRWLEKQNEPDRQRQNAANDAVATEIVQAVQLALAA